MTLDSLITVLGLLVAVYAVVPRVRRLEFRLRFGMLGWLLVALTLASILYLQFYQSLRTLGLTPGFNLARWDLNPNNFSFVVLLAASLLIITYLSLRKLTRRHIFQFREFILELSRERRYAEMYSLVHRNLAVLSRIYHANFILSRTQRYLKIFSNRFSIIYLDSISRRDHERTSLESHIWALKTRIYPMLAKAFPAYSRESDAAREVIHELLMNRRTVRGMIEARPYCALAFFEYNFNEYSTFFDTYLEELAKDIDSVYYHEIKHNQNQSHTYAYDLPDRNRLLYFLFADCSVAEKLAPYKPVGETVISELDRLYLSEVTDLYNGPMRDFYETSKWESIIYVGIRFFDIMVTSALYQKVNWHMWLYYLPIFAERIARNLEPDIKFVDLNSEWPTRYHFLLYEIVSSLCNWASAVEHVPLTQSNVMLEKTYASHENGNIPKSAMLALGRVFKAVFASKSMDERFMRYLANIAFRTYFELRAQENLRLYSEALLNALRAGGFSMSSAQEGYSAALLDSFSNIDLVPYNYDACNEVRALLESDVENS